MWSVMIDWYDLNFEWNRSWCCTPPTCLLLFTSSSSARARKKNTAFTLKLNDSFFHLLWFLNRKTCFSYPPCQNLVCFWTWQHPSSFPCFYTVGPFAFVSVWACNDDSDSLIFFVYLTPLKWVFLKNRFLYLNESQKGF